MDIDHGASMVFDTVSDVCDLCSGPHKEGDRWVFVVTSSTDVPPASTYITQMYSQLASKQSNNSWHGKIPNVVPFGSRDNPCYRHLLMCHAPCYETLRKQADGGIHYAVYNHDTQSHRINTDPEKEAKYRAKAYAFVDRLGLVAEQIAIPGNAAAELYDQGRLPSCAISVRDFAETMEARDLEIACRVHDPSTRTESLAASLSDKYPCNTLIQYRIELNKDTLKNGTAVDGAKKLADIIKRQLRADSRSHKDIAVTVWITKPPLASQQTAYELGLFLLISIDRSIADAYETKKGPYARIHELVTPPCSTIDELRACIVQVAQDLEHAITSSKIGIPTLESTAPMESYTHLPRVRDAPDTGLPQATGVLQFNSNFFDGGWNCGLVKVPALEIYKSNATPFSLYVQPKQRQHMWDQGVEITEHGVGVYRPYLADAVYQIMVPPELKVNGLQPSTTDEQEDWRDHLYESYRMGMTKGAPLDVTVSIPEVYQVLSMPSGV